MIKNDTEYEVTCKAYEKLCNACNRFKKNGFKNEMEKLEYEGIKSQCLDLKYEIDQYNKKHMKYVSEEDVRKMNSLM